MENIKEQIREIISGLSNSDFVWLFNQYCENDRRMDDYIYPMYDFDEIMQGETPWEIARCSYYSGKFCPAHDYFWFNGYGNLESSDFPEHDFEYAVDDMAGYIVDNWDSLGNDEIQEILDQVEGKEV